MCEEMLVKKVEKIEDSSIVRSRGRSKNKRLLEIYSLSLDQIHDTILWRQLIHVDRRPNLMGKCLGLGVLV
jgi:hypothetical protein